MKATPLHCLVLIIAVSCHSSDKEASSADTMKTAFDSVKMYPGSTKTDTHPAQHPKNDTAMARKTHLRDTSYADGNFILFLRPDDARYAQLENELDGGVDDADSDFGVGIRSTMDSLEKDSRYAMVKALTSTKRYIAIRDCKGGPLVIDRDSVNYGIILSGKGKRISTRYNSVHSGNYLGEIGDYFSLR